MKHWRAIFEGAGMLSVIASLIFVGVQLRQEQRIARADLGSGSFVYMSALNQAQMDPKFSPVYEKMLRAPQELTTEEMIRVNAFLLMAADFLARECYLYERGMFASCDYAYRDISRRYFRNAYAQAWWKASDARREIDVPPWVEAQLSSQPIDGETKIIEDIRDAIEGDTNSP